MNALPVVIGVLIGMFVVAACVFAYLLLTTLKSLITSVNALLETLRPVFASDEIRNSLGAFGALAKQGSEMGARLDSLIESIKMFYQFAFVRPEITGRAAPEPTPEQSGVFPYDEEVAAAKEASIKAKKIEQESKLYVSPSEVGSSADVY